MTAWDVAKWPALVALFGLLSQIVDFRLPERWWLLGGEAVLARAAADMGAALAHLATGA